MTHFTVVVVGNNPEELLEPFNENTTVAPYISLTPEQVREKFHDIRKRYMELENPTMTDLFKRTLELDEPDKQWVKDYYGNVDENGNVLSTYNPDSKWDWHTLGGRWTGVFYLKPGALGRLGAPGVFDNKPEAGKVDQCTIGDVDWDRMNKEAAEYCAEEWDRLFAPYDPKTCFFREEWVEGQKALHLKLYETKEKFVQERGVWTPYAFLSAETGWVAPGEMGWWGMSSDDTEDRDDFCKKFPELIAKFPPDTLISCFDCHI